MRRSQCKTNLTHTLMLHSKERGNCLTTRGKSLAKDMRCPRWKRCQKQLFLFFPHKGRTQCLFTFCTPTLSWDRNWIVFHKNSLCWWIQTFPKSEFAPLLMLHPKSLFNPVCISEDSKQDYQQQTTSLKVVVLCHDINIMFLVIFSVFHPFNAA